MLSSSAQVFAASFVEVHITAGYVAEPASVDLLVFWLILPPDEGALHPQQTEHKAQHAQRKSWHQEPTHNLDGAWSHMEGQVDESAGVSSGLVLARWRSYLPCTDHSTGKS